MLRRVMADLDGACVDILLFMRKGKASGNKARDTAEDQENANDCCCFHKCSFGNNRMHDPLIVLQVSG